MIPVEGGRGARVVGGGDAAARCACRRWGAARSTRRSTSWRSSTRSREEARAHPGGRRRGARGLRAGVRRAPPWWLAPRRFTWRAATYQQGVELFGSTQDLPSAAHVSVAFGLATRSRLRLEDGIGEATARRRSWRSSSNTQEDAFAVRREPTAPITSSSSSSALWQLALHILFLIRRAPWPRATTTTGGVGFGLALGEIRLLPERAWRGRTPRATPSCFPRRAPPRALRNGIVALGEDATRPCVLYDSGRGLQHACAYCPALFEQCRRAQGDHILGDPDLGCAHLEARAHASPGAERSPPRSLLGSRRRSTSRSRCRRTFARSRGQQAPPPMSRAAAVHVELDGATPVDVVVVASWRGCGRSCDRRMLHEVVSVAHLGTRRRVARRRWLHGGVVGAGATATCAPVRCSAGGRLRRRPASVSFLDNELLEPPAFTPRTTTPLLCCCCPAAEPSFLGSAAWPPPPAAEAAAREGGAEAGRRRGSAALLRPARLDEVEERGERRLPAASRRA